MQELPIRVSRKRSISITTHGGELKHLVEFPLEGGGSIVVEIDEPETGGTVRAGREDKIEQASASANFGVTVRWTGKQEGITPH